MVTRLSAALGWRPMPWQQLVADVANEIEPSTGEWAYSTIIVEVQRQAGKTSLVGGTGVHRAITGPDRGVWYTAQTRQHARDNFMELVKRVRRSPLKPPLVKIRESNGSEGLTFPTGSEYRVFAPGEDALHGKATHLVTIDEGWAFDEARGDELLQAIIPTFTTTPGQLFVLSAAGTARSTWFRGMVDTGRMFVEAGRTDTIAYFGWGIGDDVDPTDLGAVALAHPGYGYTLRPNGLIQAASTLKPGEFARAYGSRWTGAAERAIPALLWASAAAAGTALPARFAVGFDVGLDGDDAAIVIAWRDPATGKAHVEVADVRDGAAWLTGRLLQLVADQDVAAVLYDRFGPAVAAGDAAERAGLAPLDSTTTDQYVTACAGFLGELVAGTLTYTPHPALDAAVEAAGKRAVGDRWAWGRRVSTSTIAPLVAATLALWAFDHAPPPPEPFVVR
jgi:hypothetical protein